MVLAGWYALVVGALMIAQWAFFIFTGQVPELQAEPLRIGFHLAAEGATAVLLIIAGVGLLRSRKWSRDLGLVAFGSLVYTSIVSPGYFAQLGQWRCSRCCSRSPSLRSCSWRDRSGVSSRHCCLSHRNRRLDRGVVGAQLRR